MNQLIKTYAAAKCAWCDGMGTRSAAPGNRISCIVCGGKGHVSIAQPARPCQNCQGSGKRASNLCYQCGGTGWETVPGKDKVQENSLNTVEKAVSNQE